MFDKKGLILTTLKTGSSLDDAETDGIEVLQAHNYKCSLIHPLVLDQLGAEEVVLVDEEESGKLLQFTTDPGDLAVVQQGMVGIGYKIEEVYMLQLTWNVS